jgi:hypothetical protein
MLPEFGSCCCTCKHRLTDYHHCTTTGPVGTKEAGSDGCVCSKPRGFICYIPEMDGRAYSGWGEHGLCELHWLKDKDVKKE